MTADTQDLFQQIAQALARRAPQGWTTVKVTTVIDSETMSTSQYDYVDGQGNEHWFDPDSGAAAEIGRSLRAIRAAAVAGGHEGWSRCTFLVVKDGTFTFDISYDR